VARSRGYRFVYRVAGIVLAAPGLYLLAAGIAGVMATAQPTTGGELGQMLFPGLGAAAALAATLLGGAFAIAGSLLLLASSKRYWPPGSTDRQ
jgi:hypothetical protein